MAQETQPFTATPLSPDSLITIEKASASSANPGMASVIVQLKDEPLATYGGGIPGLDPTSPRVTGEKKLNLNSRASQAYLNHLAKKHADFKGQAQAHLNKVQFTQDYDLVLNGVAALVPLEQLSDLGALPGGGLGAQAASSRIAANQERRSIFRLILRLYGISAVKTNIEWRESKCPLLKKVSNRIILKSIILFSIKNEEQDMAFIGRNMELHTLDRLWQSNQGAEFLILYGRRRVGKTALLAHWIQTRNPRALYWVATPDSALAQLRSFSQAVYTFGRPNIIIPENFTFGSWEQAWEEVVRLAEQERIAVFIDEFTYLLETAPAIAGKLQNFWDQRFQKCNLFLCLSGSHLGMMMREVLSYQAPLYGRASAQMHLKPLPFGLTHKFFPRFSAVDRVAIYAMFGGIPAYWERLDQKRSITYNIKNQLLTPNNLMQAEPRLLLQDFISEPHNYLAVLTAIANGSRKPKDIANYTGLPNVQVPKYLSVLSEAGFVERRTSVTAAPNSRTGRHHITDPYLRYYFRFLAARQNQLELGIQDQALAEITRHMIDFIGTHTWEELCREWLLRASAKKQLPFLPDEVGSAWNSTVQIDVAGINTMEKTLILGECKWTNLPIDRDVLAKLVEEKTQKIVPSEGKWRVFFLGFSRSGWTEEAIQFQKELQKRKFKGENWQAVGMRLVDLNQLDQDLEHWSESASQQPEEILY